MKWRKWNNIIHRDLGYLAFGLTVIYAISGLAVNHMHDWNPNYKVVRTAIALGPVADEAAAVTLGQAAELAKKIDPEARIKSIYPLNPETLQMFFEDGRSVTVEVRTGRGEVEKVSRRVILQEMNFLHLNTPRKLWTYMADLYAIVLLLLAVTGIFVIKGKKGIKGRGAWLVSIGVMIPVVFLWAYFY